MSRNLRCLLVLGLMLLLMAQPKNSLTEDQTKPKKGRVFYIRQTMGDDTNDGLSPQTAWRRLSKLSNTMQSGDAAYVGPGLYREQIIVRADGTAEQPIRLIADPMGRYTGDPPGSVMITGAEPVDESRFTPYPAAGVYMTPFTDFQVTGVVEMDGPQYRYFRARSTKEHLREGLSELEVVAKKPSTYFYNGRAQVLYLHTSDGKPPAEHEIELMKRGAGISIVGRRFVTAVGFTFRHTGDAGITIGRGSEHVTVLNNISYGSRQGIRVNNAANVLISGNTLFRNENSGVYFLRESVQGFAVSNILYENVKGVRWGSRSNNGLAVGNIAFDNHEAGISIEDTAGVKLARNRMVDNGQTQLLVIGSRYHAEGNCFATADSKQLIAKLSYFDRFKSVAEYRQSAQQDLGSREGNCGSLPAKIDVHKLHAEALSYAERARKILEKKEGEPGDSGGKKGTAIE